MKNELVKLAIAGMLAGGISACSEDLQTSTNVPSAAHEAFKVDCEEKGGTYQFNENCAANHECAGLAISKDGIVDSECAGKTGCDGSAVCNGVDQPSSAATTAPMSSAAAAMTLAKFKTDCTDVGVVSEHICAGHNDCKGQSFNEDTGAVSTHDCKGMASCKGATCVVES
ncbi:MAG: hypothetical protein OCD01_00245 [Fibrobacterales bacterium]